MRGHLGRMHSEVPIDDALRKVVDDTSPEEYCPGQGSQQSSQQSVAQPIKRDLKCDICNTYSANKQINMYQHVWRMHKGVSMREVMKRINNAADACEV